MDRRIAAILAADMVGFSRLVEADEADVLGRQKAHREALIDPALARWNGRIVKTTGDGLIAVFESVADAVRAAAEVQRGMAAREAEAPEARRIRYRVGVHLGDVVFDGGDVFGDGVNVAARLEGLAEPGGVVVSGTAHDVLKSVTEVGWRSLGEVRVKNLARPVRAFALLDDPAMAGRTVGERGPAWRRWAAAAAVLAAVAAGGAAWQAWRPDFAPADPAKMAYALPEEPSIAVLPFDNLTADPALRFVADGTAEAVTAMLTDTPGLFVIARNSAFEFRDGKADLAEVAEALGVQFVLTGSVQRAADQLKVSAQLNDALAGRSLWAETLERPVDELFEVQSAIAARVADEAQATLTIGPQARAWRDRYPDAESFRLSMEARDGYLDGTLEGWKRSATSLAALEKRVGEPPHGALAWHHWIGFIGRFAKPDLAGSRARAEAHVDAALQQEPDNGNMLILRALMAARDKRFDDASRLAEAAYESAPNWASVVAGVGLVETLSGRPSDGLPMLRRSLRLEPYAQPWVSSEVGWASLMAGRHEDARKVFDAFAQDPDAAPRYIVRAEMGMAYLDVIDGAPEKARARVASVRAEHPRALAILPYWIDGYDAPAFNARFRAALVEAGLHELKTDAD